MSIWQQIVTIAMCSIATMTTRFLPFIIFGKSKKVPKVIDYLGKVLPSAVFGMLVIYCFKDVNIISGNHGLPEFISAVVVVIVHLIWKNMFLSIAVGTICCMLLTQLVF